MLSSRISGVQSQYFICRVQNPLKNVLCGFHVFCFQVIQCRPFLMNSCLSVYALQYDVFLDKAKENIKSICRSPSKENFPFFFFFLEEITLLLCTIWRKWVLLTLEILALVCLGCCNENTIYLKNRHLFLTVQGTGESEICQPTVSWILVYSCLLVVSERQRQRQIGRLISSRWFHF